MDASYGPVEYRARRDSSVNNELDCGLLAVRPTHGHGCARAIKLYMQGLFFTDPIC